MKSANSLTIFAPSGDSVPATKNLADLENAARDLNSRINQGEQSLIVTLWELGDVLVSLRPQYPHGTWETELARLGIEQTRAKRAIWLRVNHARPDGKNDESVSQLYAKRPRKQVQPRKNARQKAVVTQQSHGVAEKEFAAFTQFVAVCGNLDRAMAVVESCRSLYMEVAVNE